MKFTNLKATLTKALLGTVAAGALLFAAQPKADAQVFVRFGYPAPVVVAPRPVYVAPYGYYARRDAWARHEDWRRDHRFGYYR
jgi:hypothetical protein